MNGIGCLLSKSFSPIYNTITSNKAGIIPFRSPNFLLPIQSTSPLVANTRVLKHRVYSSSYSKDVTNSSSPGSTTSDAVGPFEDLPYLLIVYGIMGLALRKVWEVVAQSISFTGGIKGNIKLKGLFLGVAIGLVARDILKKIMGWTSEPHCRIGDIIEVESHSLEGRVIKKLPKWTVLLGAQNREITVPNSLFSSYEVRTPARWYDMWYDIMSFDVRIESDDSDKIEEISNEIVEMMESNQNVLLEVRQPSRYTYKDLKFCFSCHLKHKNPDIYFTAKEDIIKQSVEIIKKHGATCNLYSQ